MAYGVVQVVAPATVARSVGARTDHDSLLVRRTLGGRHVVQGVLLLGAPRGYHLVGGTVDVTHAVTAFAWAFRDRARRGDAVINAAASLALAIAETAR